MAKATELNGEYSDYYGMWFHPDKNYYSSQAINLSVLKKFKGAVRFYIFQNRFYENGVNGRPKYQLLIADCKSDNVREFKFHKPDDECEEVETERLYTYDEVQTMINRCACEVGGDREYGEHLVEDYDY